MQQRLMLKSKNSVKEKNERSMVVKRRECMSVNEERRRASGVGLLLCEGGEEIF